MTDLELLAAAVKERGSMRKVGEAIGVSVTVLSLIQRDKYIPVEPTFVKLRKRFGYLKQGKTFCPGAKSEIHIEVCKRYAEAVRDGKTLVGFAFLQVREVCPYCVMGAEIISAKKAW